jgi:hypothetical protein
VRTENRLPIVAARDYVVEPALYINSRLARHSPAILLND